MKYNIQKNIYVIGLHIVDTKTKTTLLVPNYLLNKFWCDFYFCIRLLAWVTNSIPPG